MGVKGKEKLGESEKKGMKMGDSIGKGKVLGEKIKREEKGKIKERRILSTRFSGSDFPALDPSPIPASPV